MTIGIETAAAHARRRCLRVLAAAAIGGAGLALTIIPDRAQAQVGTSHIISLEIRRGKLTTPKTVLRIAEGADVRLLWTTDKTAALHLHGYDIFVLASPGRLASMSFRADLAGRFPVSIHDIQHRALIYLEIYPR